MQEELKAKSAPSRSKDNDRLIARRIQSAMIPRRLPSVEGLELASMYHPCPTIGGDLFDVFPLSDDLLVFLIFDVCGHQISSTLVSALARVRFLSHIRSIWSPRVVIERVNADLIRDLETEFYLTAFVGYLDLHDNRLTYSNAGHINPVICRSAENTLVRLESQGTFIGILDNGNFDEQCVYLNPGDRLVLFTDGLLSIAGNTEDPQSRTALDLMIQKELSRYSPTKFVERVWAWIEEAGRRDAGTEDISLIVAEVLTQSRRNQIKEKLGFPPDSPVYLQTLSYFEETDHAAGIVLSAMDTFGYPDDIIRKMKVSLTELLVNAIRHGNGKDFAKKVFMGHIVDDEKTMISIMDEGPGFDPGTVPDPTLPENLAKCSGRGLFIVRHYVDKMEHNACGNRVTITKFHPYG